MDRVTVGEVMTRAVVTVTSAMTVAEVAALLRGWEITGAPVVDGEGRVLGVVSELDVIAREGATVGDIMSRQVFSVSEDTDIEDVGRLFYNQRIRRVPVVRAGQLVGIVSRSDLLDRPALRHFLPGDLREVYAERESDP
jgi:CBS domain-containing protein